MHALLLAATDLRELTTKLENGLHLAIVYGNWPQICRYFPREIVTASFGLGVCSISVNSQVHAGRKWCNLSLSDLLRLRLKDTPRRPINRWTVTVHEEGDTSRAFISSERVNLLRSPQWTFTRKRSLLEILYVSLLKFQISSFPSSRSWFILKRFWINFILKLKQLNCLFDSAEWCEMFCDGESPRSSQAPAPLESSKVNNGGRFTRTSPTQNNSSVLCRYQWIYLHR